MLLVTTITFAQINSNANLTIDKSKLKEVKTSHKASNPKTVNDTVGLNDYTLLLQTGEFYYNPLAFFQDGSPMGGFMVSPIISSQSFSAEGILFAIAGIDAAAGSTLNSKIYLGAGYYTLADSVPHLLASDSIIFSQLDTTAAHGGWNTKLFTNPVQFPTCTRPFVRIDFAKTTDAGDTIFGLLYDGSFSQLDQVVKVKVSGAWGWYFLNSPWSFFEAWIIAASTTGIVGSSEFINGIQLSQNYPNPSIDGFTTINYALDKSFNNVTLDIMDINGKMIESLKEGSKSTGTYSITLKNNLAPGIYIYSLNVDGYRFTKKMVIE